MGPVPGFKFSMMRAAGMVLNLIGLILSLVFALAYMMKNTSWPLILGPLIGIGLFIFFLKASMDAVEDHRGLLLWIAVIVGFVLEVILFAIFPSSWSTFEMVYLPAIGSFYLLAICWHYTLSIYLVEKNRFVLSAIGYALLWTWASLMIGLIGILPLAFVVVAVVLTLVAEQILISKKLMNYIKPSKKSKKPVKKSSAAKPAAKPVAKPVAKPAPVVKEEPVEEEPQPDAEPTPEESTDNSEESSEDQ